MTAMPAPKSNHYAKGNKGGKGGPGKFQSEYIEIAARLCERGLTDEDIAEVLGVSERTIHSWKLRHEEFAAALKRNKELANAIVEASLFKRANGFEHEVEKATASGKKVTIKEYFPPTLLRSVCGCRTECQRSTASRERSRACTAWKRAS
jgi:predicted transcriptional regulator